jgi:hypothetical protein
VYERERLRTTKCNKPLSHKAFFSPQMSIDVRLCTHGVQGVASSNPAVPTNEANGLASKGASPFLLVRPSLGAETWRESAERPAPRSVWQPGAFGEDRRPDSAARLRAGIPVRSLEYVLSRCASRIEERGPVDPAVSPSRQG